MTTNPKVDGYLRKAKQWRSEFKHLRQIALDCALDEDFKWRNPCYTLGGKNIVLMHGFKDYCALLFFKGALLNDPAGVLIQQTENSQAARQMRFTSVQEIIDMTPTITATIQEAIAVEKAGLTVDFKATAAYTVPDEFQEQLDANPALQAAFEALTPGRQRAYLLHFSAAKQAKTRASRVTRCVPKILAGEGLND